MITLKEKTIGSITEEHLKKLIEDDLGFEVSGIEYHVMNVGSDSRLVSLEFEVHKNKPVNCA